LLPVLELISKAVCFDQLNDNVDDGVVRAALVTTRGFTSEPDRPDAGALICSSHRSSPAS
jgi:hypothetical protein